MNLEIGQSYSTEDLQNLLKKSGRKVKGADIARSNMIAWHLIGVAQSEIRIESTRKRYVQLTDLGRELKAAYSTNRELFFDLMHFLFYSAWHRSNHLRYAKLWLYATECETLWIEAPGEINTSELTLRLQSEAKRQFPSYSPAFPSRSITAVYPWLGALTPAFLEKQGMTGSSLMSKKRSFCSPQLFHLATDLLYTGEDLGYGTQLGVSDSVIEKICRVCLLDTNQFWTMADLTSMMIREFDIKRSQWGRSIVLASPPTWIDLPDYSSREDEADEDDIDVVADDETDEDEGELWI